MPPTDRFVPRFAAEPPQEGLPYGRWAQRLGEELLSAWSAIEGGDDSGSGDAGSGAGRDGDSGVSDGGRSGGPLGEPGEIVWYPDRSWHGWTYVPATSRTSEGYELFGYVRFAPGRDGGEASGFSAHGDFTAETAERNPEWRLDICEEAIGSWRGKGGGTATMTLVWGRPLLAGGAIATAELGGVTVDQCELVEGRFTLIAPDDYQHDLLEVALWGARGQELARESLYEGEEDGTVEDGTVGDDA